MIEWAMNMINSGKDLLIAGLGLYVLWMIIKTFGRSGGQAVPTFVVILLGGLVLWSATNMDWFEKKVGDETIKEVSVSTGQPGEDVLTHGLVVAAGRHG